MREEESAAHCGTLLLLPKPSMILSPYLPEFHQREVFGCKGTADFLLMQTLNCKQFLFLQKSFVVFCWFWINLEFISKNETSN